MLGDAVSPAGAPAPRRRETPCRGAASLAVASCQHWEFGHYAAHRHIAAPPPDLVAFLGDYIYEWGALRRQRPHPGKRTAPDYDTLALANYRARYAQYKTDPHLQAAHLAAPWIVTWDDHEVANDYAADRDERLDRRLPGSGARRRTRPFSSTCRCAAARSRRRRRFASCACTTAIDWGRLARFHVLDDAPVPLLSSLPGARTRRPELGGRRRLPASASAPTRYAAGQADQETWLADGLRRSKANWNILAQQTLMAQSTQVPIVGRAAAVSGPMAGTVIRRRAAPVRQPGAKHRRRIRWCFPATSTVSMRTICGAISTAGIAGQSSAGDRILRHLGHLERAAARAHRAYVATEPAPEATAAATGAASC